MRWVTRSPAPNHDALPTVVPVHRTPGKQDPGAEENRIRAVLITLASSSFVLLGLEARTPASGGDFPVVTAH
ncbi:hypothetical protein [Kineococcus sp. SYSU DK005]|uniref:hypothetical protein n=1 Tax=Kineococcus sp. SYSU DK005 TaxID=3383126 RepID=UPI003D7D0EBB